MGAVSAAVASTAVADATETALILVQSVGEDLAEKRFTTVLCVRFTFAICVGSHFTAKKFHSYLRALKGSWGSLPGGCYALMVTSPTLGAQLEQ